ncbi:MAG TPA: hypothetical protein VGH33_18165 [Isosphaeraceae bacterium]
MTDAAPRPVPRRRRLALTLRAGTALVVAAALGLGWLVSWTRGQRRAIASIEAAGGEVCFDYQKTPFGSYDRSRPIPGARWLRALVGDEPFRSVVYVSLCARKTCDDAALAQVANFPRLEVLYLNGSAVTDAGLGVIRRLRHLERLDLGWTAVTDAGLANVEGLDSLGLLCLNHTNVTDAGLVHIAALRNLGHLVLSETSVGDEGMTYVAGLHALNTLDLEKTRVGKAGLQKLCGLDELVHLDITGADQGWADCLKAKRPEVQLNWITWR